jgi:hypothetical protein
LKKVAILQSSYIPWKGYFDLINQVDEFVFLEDVQFTNRDWRTRNQILMHDKKIWLSIPTKKTKRETLLNSVFIDDNQNWRASHMEKIKQSYIKHPYFREYSWILNEIYLNNIDNLSSFNINSVKVIAKVLGIDTVFKVSSQFNVDAKKDDRLIEICRQLDADLYLSGPSAQDYINPIKFIKSNLKLEYMNYDNYPIYEQKSNLFDHQVSVLDLIFSVGPKASWYIWGWKNNDKI